MSNATWKDEPPTGKQLAYLKTLGVSEVPKTKGQASELITANKDLVNCWECGCRVPKSQCEYDGGVGWYCGC